MATRNDGVAAIRKTNPSGSNATNPMAANSVDPNTADRKKNSADAANDHGIMLDASFEISGMLTA